MIAVIADDFTGAAELAGIALRHGLSVELFIDTVTECGADVLVLSTDSRSLKKDRALVATVDGLKQVQRLHPKWIYKKIDSVLRGYVVEELQLQAALTGYDKIFIAPANPSLGRTIEQGEYFVNGQRITETGFKNDPEFPATSSFVKAILHNEVSVLQHTAALPSKGIVAGEAANTAAINAWAAKLDASWMLAGAGDFFTALLEKEHPSLTRQPVILHRPHLYVCGTAFEQSRQYIRELNLQQHCVLYMQKEITEEWLQQADGIIRANNRLVIAIDETDETAAVLRQKMARAAKSIIIRNEVKEVFIEGGSTATALLNTMHLTPLRLVNEISRGVVRMRANNLYITVKPGSYQLPEVIKEVYV